MVIPGMPASTPDRVSLSALHLRKPVKMIEATLLLEEADQTSEKYWDMADAEFKASVREGDQPLPVRNTRPSVQQIIIDRLTERMALGVQRYGTTLQAHNGRDAGRDLREELYDALVYAEQVAIEQAHLDAAVWSLYATMRKSTDMQVADADLSNDERAAILEALSRHADRQS